MDVAPGALNLVAKIDAVDAGHAIESINSLERQLEDIRLGQAVAQTHFRGDFLPRVSRLMGLPQVAQDHQPSRIYRSARFGDGGLDGGKIRDCAAGPHTAGLLYAGYADKCVDRTLQSAQRGAADGDRNAGKHRDAVKRSPRGPVSRRIS